MGRIQQSQDTMTTDDISVLISQYVISDFSTSATYSWIRIRIHWDPKILVGADLDPDQKIISNVDLDLAPVPKLM